MHLRYNEKEIDQLRSMGCSGADGQMLDFMRIIDEKMDLWRLLIACFISIGTLALRKF